MISGEKVLESRKCCKTMTHDSGILIDAFEVPVSPSDDTVSLRRKYHVTGVLRAEARGSDSKFFFVSGSGVIRMCSSSHTLIFKWNENPRYSSPPVRRPSKQI